MRRTHSLLLLASVLLASVLLAAGCRGDLAIEPPIHLNPNMDNQKYIESQEGSKFWKDGRGMRPQVKGTIAIGELRENDRLYRGMVGNQLTKKLPVKLTENLLKRGKERYNIYCRPCHGRTGTGKNAPVVTKGIVIQPTSYLETRLRKMPIGHFFQVITKGIRNMPSYAVQIPVHDRWAIAAYVRVLQIAGSQPIERIPSAVRQRKGWSK
ncbi:MAG: cytochrome c [Myxococcales bacterium]|nr:cytochrome c [Myxococcales bacterium]